MNKYIQNLINWLNPRRYGFDHKAQAEKDAKNDTFEFGWFGKPYQAKNTRVNNMVSWQKIKNQKQVNGCIDYGASTQREKDEGFVLSPGGLAAKLRSLGLHTKKGSTLSAAQDVMRKWGIPEETVCPTNNSSYEKFSSSKQLTNEVTSNAAKHKIASYWKTYKVDKMLEQLDRGRIGHTACKWYSSFNIFNVTGVKAILMAFRGWFQGGHAFSVVGYNLDYHGYKVLIFANSFGEKYGDKGLFYIKFEDVNKFLIYGTYFNEDMPKNVTGWTSIYDGFLVQDINSPKIYYLRGGKKRHVPDEAMWYMLMTNVRGQIVDRENMLEQVKDGKPMTFEELPDDIRNEWKVISNGMQDERVKNLFNKYFK